MEIITFNAQQIGGCFTMYKTDKSAILVDYGSTLAGTKQTQEEFDWKKNKIDAVFITHYHGDHAGRIMEIPDGIPIYMGEATKKVMLNIHNALACVPELKEEQERIVARLNSDQIHIVIKNKRITKIEGFTITPYLVDHSAYDAYMYLIEADGKRALHTGDFRGHGYRGKALIPVIEGYVHQGEKQVDYLVTEGTMMGERINEKAKTEFELQQEARKLFKEHKHVFLICSSTNLDSLSSFYQAAKYNGMKMYCYNYYLYSQLKTFTKTAGEACSLYKFDNIELIKYDKHQAGASKNISKYQVDDMRDKGFLCVIQPDEKYAAWIEQFADVDPIVVYSQWNGYLNPKHAARKEKWIEFLAPFKASKRFFDLHTSGHATAETITEVIKAVNPQEEIIPMHTENILGFRELNITKEQKEMVRTTNQYHLTDDEKKLMDKMDDNRSLYYSDTDEKQTSELSNKEILWKEYHDEDGAFAEFRKYVDLNKKDLAVCFRGNGSPASIKIYHNNHVVWELFYASKKFRVKFNFDHARYTEDWESKLTLLKEIYHIESDKKIKKVKDKGASYGELICLKPDNENRYSKDLVEKSAKIIIRLIDDFFDPTMKRDYFKESVYLDCEKNSGSEQNNKSYDKEDKTALIEKRWQQSLFYHLKDNMNGLYVYDLEFSQKFPSSPDEKNPRTNTIKSKMKDYVNEPDMLAVRFEEGKPVSIVLIEVKSTYSACLEPSGIYKHVRGMYAYSTEEMFMKNRRIEACDLLNSYISLGHLKCNYKNKSRYESSDFVDLPCERMLILTNDAYLDRGGKEVEHAATLILKSNVTVHDALEYYEGDEKRKEKVDKLCKDFDCTLRVIRKPYYKGYDNPNHH